MKEPSFEQLLAALNVQVVDDTGTITVQSLCDRDATVVKVTTSWGRSATGSAKREPGDVHDPQIGEMLALSRALANLAADARREATAMVTAAERRRQEAISARVRKAERRALQRNSPWLAATGQRLDAMQVRENWGEEAARKHAERALRHAREENGDHTLHE